MMMLLFFHFIFFILLNSIQLKLLKKTFINYTLIYHFMEFKEIKTNEISSNWYQNRNEMSKCGFNHEDAKKEENQKENKEFFDFEKQKKQEESSNQSYQQKNQQKKTLKQETDSIAHHTDPELLLQYISQLSSQSQKSTFDNHSPFPSLQCFQTLSLDGALSQNLLFNDSFQKTSNFVEDILVVSIERSKYSEIISIQIQCGWYRTKLLILNLSQRSCIHSCAELNDYGAFGNVYFVKSRGENYAVKCISTNHRHQGKQYQLQDKLVFLVGVLKEYFFLKFFSQLQIGPKLKKIYGFDLVISPQCAEFSMQICRNLDFNAENEIKLKENIKLMHSMQIVHRDIKFNNLMWSDEYQTPVFIDFGGTTFIKENLGYKTKTKFVGTIGFVSPQMLQIFILKQGIIDLYFNDLYGLKKSSQLKRNANLQQNKRVSINQVNQLRNVELYLYLIKHKMFKKQYQDLFLIWSQMQHFFFYQFEQIEFKILSFLIDLPPTPTLMKIYWSLSEQIRCLQQFQQLKDIYSDESSIIISSWMTFQFKQQLFHQEISLYRYVELEYLNLNQFQKEVQSILISQQTIEEYINVNDNFKNLFQNQKEVNICCLVAVYYCTLTHQRYRFNVQKKLQRSRKIIQALREYHRRLETKNAETSAKTIDFLELFFSCKLKRMKPIATLFQYFFFKVWHKIPERFKEKSLKEIISTLQLLGYPFYLDNARYFFLYHLFFNQIQKSECFLHLNVQEKMEGILKYWKAFALIKMYDQIFYDKSSSNFHLSQMAISGIIEKARQYEIQLMKPDSNHLVFEANYNFYLFHRHYRKASHRNDFILGILSNAQISNTFIESKFFQKFYNEWKYNILLILNLLPQKYLTSIQIGFINEQRIKMMEFQNKNQFSFHFTPYLIFCKRNSNLQRVSKMLKIIDKMIACGQVSQRIFIQLRIFLAWKDKDVKTIKKLSSMIFNESKQFSIQNFLSLTQIITIFHSILIHQRLKFWLYVMRKLICFEYLNQIIERVKNYINYYLYSLQFQILQPQKIRKSTLKKNCNVSTQVDGIRMTELQAVDVLDCMKTSLWLLSTVVRFADMLLSNAKQFKLKKTTQRDLSKCPTPVQHLHRILPQTLKRSIFLNYQSQSHLRQFITLSIQKLSSPNIIYFKYCQQKQIMNSREMLEMKIADYDDIEVVINTVEKQFSQQQLNVRQKKIENGNQRRPSPRVLALYYISRVLVNQERNIEDYQNLILSYNTWKRRPDSFKVLFQTMLVGYLFNAFVYCQQNYSQFFDFLLSVAQNIKMYPQSFAIQVFYETLKGKFSLQNSQFFPFKPENWRPLQFIDYNFQQLPKLSLETDSYFSLVLEQCLKNNFISHKVRKRFFLFMIKSLQTMKHSARSLIIYCLYEQTFNLKIVERGWYDPGQYSSNGKQIKPQIKINFDNEKVVKKEFYHAQKTLKMEDRVADIQFMVSKRFKLKKLRRPHWKIPPFIQKMYHKKLYKYHFIRGGFDDNEFEIGPHADLINQLCQQMKRKDPENNSQIKI